MKNSIKLPKAINPVRDSSYRSPLRRGSPSVQPIWIVRGFILIPLALGWLAFSTASRAVTPAPDGAYPGQNTAEGYDALFSLITGTGNVAIGNGALYHNTYGGDNVATGLDALYHNTEGDYNTAVGYNALFHNTTGSNNTANGVYALYSNRNGHENTAVGDFALNSNTTGSDNTASGTDALFSNTTGANNTATGVLALNFNSTGGGNVANGTQALYYNGSCFGNTAIGFQALLNNTDSSSVSGNNNTGVGLQALLNNSTGSNNVALGSNAGGNLTTGSSNIDIGNLGVAGEANTIRIGNAVATLYPDGTTHPAQAATYIAGISGRTVASGVAVIVGTNGHLGTIVSSARYKDEIKPMDKASEAILALKPVTFRYKKELDPDGIPQFGLVAEQVEKVNPALVARDAQGKVFTVRYEAVNAMLLNEFLKEHRKLEALQASFVQQQRDFQGIAAQQETEIKSLTASLKEQASQIQKVSAQVEVSKPALRTVLNNQ